MIKGAIFDLDGTLLDSMMVWENMGEIYLKSLGMEPRENLNETFLTMSLAQAAEYYISEYGVKLSVSEIMKGINDMTARFYNEELKLKNGVSEFLEILYSSGVKMCVATATDRPHVEAALKRCGADKYFSDIFTCTEVGAGKTEPKIFRMALESLGTEKKNTVIFEDSLYAIETAKKDGFTVAAISDRFQKDPERIRAAADVVIESYYELSDFKELVQNL